MMAHVNDIACANRGPRHQPRNACAIGTRSCGCGALGAGHLAARRRLWRRHDRHEDRVQFANHRVVKAALYEGRSGVSRPAHQCEFVSFLQAVVETQPGRRKLPTIVDNLPPHKTQQVRAFVAAHPHVYLHHTPTDFSWFTQVELWFSKIERDVMVPGIFPPLPTCVASSCIHQALQQDRNAHSVDPC